MSLQVAAVCLLCWLLGAFYGWVRHEEHTCDRPLYRVVLGLLPINV